MITLDYTVTFDVNNMNVGDRVMINHLFIKGPFVVVSECWEHSCSIVIRPAKGNYLVLPEAEMEHELPTNQVR